MGIFPTFFDGASLLLGIVLLVASFVSKTMVSGGMMGGKPQKITWFGRIWMFVFGSAFIYQSVLAILKQRHVAINPSWVDIGQPLSKAVMYVLFLSLVVPLVIVAIRDSWLKRKEQTRIQRIISLLMVLIFLYLIWEATPIIFKEVLAVFHHPSSGRVG